MPPVGQAGCAATCTTPALGIVADYDISSPLASAAAKLGAQSQRADRLRARNTVQAQPASATAAATTKASGIPPA